jgi:dihydroxyacetone kinase-like predicted kinase
LLSLVPDAVPAKSGVVAVVAGDGNRKLFERLAAQVGGPIAIVEGGQTMNPSTADLLKAVQSLDAEEAIILPNNSNVVLAAEHAAANADRTAEVVPATSIPAGLAAMVAYDAARTAAENAREMREAVAAVTTGEVTIASRDVQMNGIPITKGEWLGLSDGEPVAGGSDFDDVALAVVERLLSEPRELLTFLVGRDGAELQGVLDRIAEEHPDVEVDVQEGGQPHYHLLLSAE